MKTNPYQVAITADPSIPYRQWNHIGTYWAPTHKSAAYDAHKGAGDIINELNGEHGIIYQFADGSYACVGFGYSTR